MGESTLSEDELKRFGYDLCILTITLTENYPICLKSITLMFDTLATNLAIDVYPLHLEQIPSRIKEIVNPRFVLNNPARQYKKFSEELQKPLNFNEEKFQHVQVMNFLNRVVLKSIRITNIYEKLKSGYFSNFSRNAHNVKSTKNPNNMNKKEHTPYFDQLRKVVLLMLNDIEPFVFSINCLKILFDSFIEYDPKNKESRRIYFKDYLPDGIYYIYNLLLLLKDVRNFLEQIPAPEAFLQNGMKRREMLNITGTFLDYINKIGQMTDNFQKYCIKNNYLAKIYTNNILFQTWCHASKFPKVPNIHYRSLKTSVMIDLGFLQKKEPPNILQLQFFKRKVATACLGKNDVKFHESLFFKQFVTENLFNSTAVQNNDELQEFKTKSLKIANNNEAENSESSTSSELQNRKASNLYNEFINEELPYQYPKITNFLNDNRFYRSLNYCYLLILLRILGFSFSSSNEMSVIEVSPESAITVVSGKLAEPCEEVKTADNLIGKDACTELPWDSILKKCDFEINLLSTKLLLGFEHLNDILMLSQKNENSIYTVLNAIKSSKFSYAYALFAVLVSFNSILLITSNELLCDKNIKKTYAEQQDSSEVPGLSVVDYMRLALYGTKLVAAYAASVCSSLSAEKLKQSQESIKSFYSIFQQLLFTKEEIENHSGVMTSVRSENFNGSLLHSSEFNPLTYLNELTLESTSTIDPKKFCDFLLSSKFRSFVKICQFLSFRLLLIPTSQQEWLMSMTDDNSMTHTAKHKQFKELEHIILKDDEIIKLNSDFWTVFDEDMSHQVLVFQDFYKRDLFLKSTALKLNRLNLCLNGIIDVVRQDPDCVIQVYDGDCRRNDTENASSCTGDAASDSDKHGLLKRILDREIGRFCKTFIEYKKLMKN